ncbi:MAG: phytanoyl-CoA dioxygenase family protein [Ilumatobacteraceae bacterium]|nr:phytanoyl-CoA dioxygenase family protein [Ilumatobacteraceae bacterium]
MGITATQAQEYQRQGWLHTQPFSSLDIANIRHWVDEVQAWPDNGDWMHYREMTDDGPRLCRTENFIPFHPQLKSLLTSGPIIEIASALLGEPAVLYKEKINYKLSGGAGYAPHQDAPAYPFVATHVSCMVAVDDSLITNGCLEVVNAHHQKLLPVNDLGCITDQSVAEMAWQQVEARAGDVLWFHSLTPHRSGTNSSATDRRAMYPTFNALREGDLRKAYYTQKLKEFRENPHTAETVQVSLINDFQGRPVR